MKRLLILVVMLLIMAVLFKPFKANAEFKSISELEDSKLYPDMLVLMLLPQIQDAVKSYYSKVLTVEPVIYPYEIDIVEAKRDDENPNHRGYDFFLIFEVNPVVGPHIAVGKDLIAFELSPRIPNTVKMKSYQHIQTNELPPNWQHILR
ncbi:DUF3888 domain-containing protein [Paenibacillus alvei]|uniref:DUF3888 domain-containing protein n=1 Tax=Paenibacillus alvei TaxID=44250 RepID=A0AAP6ZZZ6_PAEAL|nr:DUF3888 domain-containing protein [Paenibacillus alvei]NOJ73054.1 DUF3888 domain-containing protein [Paenibacillus alvei]